MLEDKLETSELFTTAVPGECRVALPLLRGPARAVRLSDHEPTHSSCMLAPRGASSSYTFCGTESPFPPYCGALRSLNRGPSWQRCALRALARLTSERHRGCGLWVVATGCVGQFSSSAARLGSKIRVHFRWSVGLQHKK